jgi:hypothetical protein
MLRRPTTTVWAAPAPTSTRFILLRATLTFSLYTPAGLDVYHDSVGAVHGSSLHGVADAQVRSAAVLGHDHVGHDVSGRSIEEPAIAMFYPPWRRKGEVAVAAAG